VPLALGSCRPSARVLQSRAEVDRAVFSHRIRRAGHGARRGLVDDVNRNHTLASGRKSRTQCHGSSRNTLVSGRKSRIRCQLWMDQSRRMDQDLTNIRSGASGRSSSSRPSSWGSSEGSDTRSRRWSVSSSGSDRRRSIVVDVRGGDELLLILLPREK